jgi:DNA-binding LacI/PurR family transcriptional regulator
MNEIFTQSQLPTAVFAANDLMAIGVIEACNAAGISIPGELSVIGVDDIETASLIHPKLSTIRQPMRELGELAVTKLLKSINGELDGETEVCLETKLIMRESIAPPSV